MSSTGSRVLQCIQSTLTNDAQRATKAPGGIWQTAAPVNQAAAPWVAYQMYTSLPDVQGRAGQLVMGHGQALVVAVGPASSGQAIQDCADWFESLLNTLQGVTIGGGTVVRIVRQREFGPVDDYVAQAGVFYTRTGFLYEWWAQ